MEKNKEMFLKSSTKDVAKHPGLNSCWESLYELQKNIEKQKKEYIKECYKKNKNPFDNKDFVVNTKKAILLGTAIHALEKYITLEKYINGANWHNGGLSYLEYEQLKKYIIPELFQN